MAENLAALQKNSDIVFLCVKPHNYKDVLDALKAGWSEQQCLISITSPVSVSQLEEVTPCQVARIVPSITNHALAGVSLFTFSDRVTASNRALLEKLFENISTPIDIQEEHIRVSSDIVSCGPAFISYLLSNWIKAAGEVAGLPEDKATALTEEMVVGLGELLSQKVMTLEELMAKVTVKGGVTGEGLQALEDNIGPLFQKMFEATQKKHKEDKATIDLS